MMYTKEHNKMVEDKCYTVIHMQKILDKITGNFDAYFDKFLKSRQSYIDDEKIDKLRDRFMVDSKGKQLVFDATRAMDELFQQAIKDFEKDRQGYLSLFDEEALEEYEDDPQQFKKRALKIETTIIRKTLQNKHAKELDKFRSAFSRAEATNLLNVVTRLAKFSQYYVKKIYNADTFEQTICYKDLKLSILDTDDYTAHGVIGGGIKSTMLYKNYPEVFPCRSRMALWALWFLVDKEKFGCAMDSEFLMIDTIKNFVQQNYFYPYELFAFYALRIYLLIQAKAEELRVKLNKAYRFVYVETFLNFVATQHIEVINELSTKYEEQAYV